jgi:regulator of sigma E protease
MEIVIKISQFILSLSILIVFHELGHFFFAKLFKTRVEKFYLFFDPWFSLFKYKKGETEYGVGWIPLGGYVKISGMIDESMDLEQMKKPAQPYEFRSKKTWQRLLIMLGGVMVNFLLAFVIYIGIVYAWGEEYLPTKNVTYGIQVDSSAYKIGLRNGDKILTIDNKEVTNFLQIAPHIALNNSKSIQIQRDSQILSVAIPDTLVAYLLKKAEFISFRVPLVVGGFAKTSAAKEAGIEKGDSIITLDSVNVQFFDELKTQLAIHKNDSVKISYMRSGTLKCANVWVPESGLLGISASNLDRHFIFKKTTYTFWEAIPRGVERGIETLNNYIKQFKLIFSPQVKGYEQLGGFISIGNIFPNTWDWESFWGLTAFLSIILAFMNVLPIPALDGGHVLFLLYEMITGQKPSDKFLEYAQITGLILVFGLILYANGNDIYRLLIK